MAFEATVQVPAGVTVSLVGTRLSVTGPKGTLERDVRFPGISFAIEDGQVTISTEATRKRVVAMVGTYASHVRNMCRGVTEGFEYRMKVVFSHFPIQLKLQGTTLVIDNFLGEKQSRYARIEPGVTAVVGNDAVTLSGIDKEKVGNSAANIEHATRIRNRDPRVFQDGIYIVERA
ncbi:MAG TPA: 50S ribosomal protein L6 [Methanoregulaceae archaeon]|nr:50S ribosomal protein L6 [Methanoregulaceae archaeon]HQJ88462.1 50S ribosomal protein L6 [Methanoregulaceae archaeon]